VPCARIYVSPAADINGVWERRVLIYATGENANVLTIRPPLVLGEQHASKLLAKIRTVFALLHG